MRIGLHLPNSGPLTASADLVAIAVEAERLGYDRVWVYDHLFNPVRLSDATRKTRPDYYNRADMPYYDALTTLSVVAGATRQIGLGTRVLIPVLRPPVALAKQLSTLAVLAGPGRLVLGVGAGWLLEEFTAVGIDPAERFARLDEHVAVMRRAWTDGITEHSGRHYAHPPVGFHPIPAAPIPVLLGGGGDVTLRRVARWADGWAMPNVEPGADAAASVGTHIARLRDACRCEDRDPSSLAIVAGAPVDAPDDHVAMLAKAGVTDLDVMLSTVDQLDMTAAAAFAAKWIGGRS